MLTGKQKDAVMNQINFVFCREMTQKGVTSHQYTRQLWASRGQQSFRSRCLPCWNSPGGGFEMNPTIPKQSPSCTLQMQVLLWIHPRFLSFGFRIRQVKARVTPARSNPQGPSMGGHNFSLTEPLFIFTCRCSCKMKKVIRELHCNEVEISHRFRYNNFFCFFLHISQPTSHCFLLTPDTPGWSWSASYPIFSFSVRLTSVNLGEKWQSPWAPLISPTQNAAIHAILKYNIIRCFFCRDQFYWPSNHQQNPSVLMRGWVKRVFMKRMLFIVTKRNYKKEILMGLLYEICALL